MGKVTRVLRSISLALYVCQKPFFPGFKPPCPGSTNQSERSLSLSREKRTKVDHGREPSSRKYSFLAAFSFLPHRLPLLPFEAPTSPNDPLALGIKFVTLRMYFCRDLFEPGPVIFLKLFTIFSVQGANLTCGPRSGIVVQISFSLG